MRKASKSSCKFPSKEVDQMRTFFLSLYKLFEWETTNIGRHAGASIV